MDASHRSNGQMVSPGRRSLDKKTTPARGMVSAFLCDRPGHGSARLLAIFRRKLRVAFLLLVVGVTPLGNRDAGKFAG